MHELTRSGLAEQDLFDVWRDGYERWDEEQADRYLDQLEAGLSRSRDHPELGRARDDIREGYRAIRIGEHLVLYMIRETDVHIVRVLSGRVDLDPLFA